MIRATSVGLILSGLLVFAVELFSSKGAAAPPPTAGGEPILGAPREATAALSFAPGTTLGVKGLAVEVGASEVFPSLGRPATLPPSATPVTSTCPDDMVEVEGDYCPYVYERCLWWLDPTTKLQCAQFAPSPACLMQSSHKKFCIDRYEWPNRMGEKPVYMVSWNEAKISCEATGKRLCSDTEWTLACEGEEHLPYPYGYKRNPKACNIDKPYPTPHPELIYNPATRDEELARLDQREASGARPECVSPFGVHDMAGNVDEWVVNETQNGWPHKSGLKGGYWGPVRTRCRPMTTAHEETFRYYQIGYRCCGDAPNAPSQPPPGGDQAQHQAAPKPVAAN